MYASLSLSADKPAMDMLKSFSPSSVDAELRGLAVEAGGSVELLSAMLQFFTFQLKTRRDYEVTQAYLSVFLKVKRTAELAFAAFLCDCHASIHLSIHPSMYVLCSYHSSMAQPS